MTTQDNENQKRWNTWGNSVRVDISPSHGQGRLAQQITRAEYDRPIPWRFFMMATVIDCDLAHLATVQVDFNVHTSTGRDTIHMVSDGFNKQGLLRMFFSGNPILVPAYKWSDRAPAPPLSDANPDVNTSPIVDVLIAQTINVDATVFYSTLGGKDLNLQLDVQLAPFENIPRSYFQELHESMADIAKRIPKGANGF